MILGLDLSWSTLADDIYPEMAHVLDKEQRHVISTNDRILCEHSKKGQRSVPTLKLNKCDVNWCHYILRLG
jgi:hypothetical protein